MIFDNKKVYATAGIFCLGATILVLVNGMDENTITSYFKKPEEEEKTYQEEPESAYPESNVASEPMPESPAPTYQPESVSQTPEPAPETTPAPTYQPSETTIATPAPETTPAPYPQAPAPETTPAPYPPETTPAAPALAPAPYPQAPTPETTPAPYPPAPAPAYPAPTMPLPQSGGTRKTRRCKHCNHEC